MHHKPNPVRLSSHPDPSGHAQIVPLGFPHHVEDEPFPHIVRDAHCLCGINLSDLISQICRNSGWQRWASLLIELQQCASHLRVGSLDFSQPHSAMHRCCGTNYCTRYYVLYSYLSTNHMQLVHQTSSSMLQVSCSNFVKYVGNVLFCPFLPFWHFFYISLTSCLLHLTGIAFLTADAAAIICGNEAIRLASHSSARREPIQRM